MNRTESKCVRQKGTIAILWVLLYFCADAAIAQKTLGGDGGDRSARDLKGTNAILISKYMMQTGHEAYYTSDPTEIQKLVRLFENNKSIPHACGYHWLIWFRQGPTNSIPISHNEDCQTYETHTAEIRSVLKRHFAGIKHHPRSFILNLRIAASVLPEEVVSALEDSHNHVFYFDGALQRLPSIRIRARSVAAWPKDRRDWESAKSKNRTDAKHKLEIDISELKKTYKIVHFSTFDLRYSKGGGDEIEDRYETQVYFPFGVSLDGIEKELKESEIVTKLSPLHYVVQLVSGENYSAALKQTLLARHQFILDLFPYPETH